MAVENDYYNSPENYHHHQLIRPIAGRPDRMRGEAVSRPRPSPPPIPGPKPTFDLNKNSVASRKAHSHVHRQLFPAADAAAADEEVPYPASSDTSGAMMMSRNHHVFSTFGYPLNAGNTNKSVKPLRECWLNDFSSIVCSILIDPFLSWQPLWKRWTTRPETSCRRPASRIPRPNRRRAKWICIDSC